MKLTQRRRRLPRLFRFSLWGLPALACLPCLAIVIGGAGIGVGIVLTIAIPALGAALLAALAAVYVRKRRIRRAN